MHFTCIYDALLLRHMLCHERRVCMKQVYNFNNMDR